jgi:hypothetical protein
MEEDFDTRLENLARNLVILKQQLQIATDRERLNILTQIRDAEMDMLQTLQRQRDHISLQNARMEHALEVIMKRNGNL